MTKAIRVLIVDDDQANTILTSEILQNAGYTVVTAADGFKAIAACKVRMPDLILLDTHMPLMSGMDVFNRLRSDEKTREIPVIFFCQRQDEAKLLLQNEMPDQDFVCKPVQPTDLLARIKTALRVKSLREEIKKKEGQLRDLSLVDPLTSLRNARYLSDFLSAEITQALRYGAPLSIVVLEMDRHRELTKMYGVKAVNSLVAQLATVMSRCNRQSDVPARLGTCEFAIVLPHTTREGAVEVAERIRNRISQGTFAVGEHTLGLTVSLGICQFVSGMDAEGKILMSHAKEALACARDQGGNVTLMAQ